MAKYGTDEWRAAISASLKGKSLSNEHRQAIAAGQKGHVVSEETRAKMREAALRRPSPSVETREKIGKASRRKTMSAEAREKIGRAQTGHKVSTETREKIRAKAAARGNRVPRVTVECAGCGKSYERRATEVAGKSVFFCTRKCRIESGVGTRPITVPRTPCETCGKPTVGYGSNPGRFCSRECLHEWQRRNRVTRICETCGREFSRPPSWETRQVARFCTRKCEAASRIKRPLDREHNGKPAVLDADGYVRVYEPSHPRATKSGWQFEHRIIVERTLGRYLRSDEHVHHINGVKDDNRPDNLVVMNHSEHSTLTGRERTVAVRALESKLAEAEAELAHLRALIQTETV